MTTSSRKRISLKSLLLVVVALLLVTSLVCPTLLSAQADSTYVLHDSLVQNSRGEWVSSNGAWNSNWERYNCYAFAIERFENPNKYFSAFQYQPGDFSVGNVYLKLKSVEYIANLVKDDLVKIGYAESTINVSTTLPSVSVGQQLVCVRTTLVSNPLDWDYHFMRYDLETDAWYHKPGTTAVLKYKYTPDNSRSWTSEAYQSDGTVKYGDCVYNSAIYFIRYNKNVFNTTQEVSSVSKNISAGKDTMIELNCKTETTGHFVVKADSEVKATLYNSEMNKITDYSGTTINEKRTLAVGKYYLQIRFIGSTTAGLITSTFYSHTNVAHCIICNHGLGGQHTYNASYVWKNKKNHLAVCECGETKLKGHAVKSGTTICLLCGGTADIGFVVDPPLSLVQYRTANGSYVLPNGVTVLVEEDIDAFLAGTLVFTKTSGDMAS